MVELHNRKTGAKQQLMKKTLPSVLDPLKIGTRGSPLALAQAVETRARLMKALGLEQEAFEIIVIKTTGDLVQDRPLSEIGGKGLFTKEIEEAMLAKDIDIAVHSMKDMPVDQPEGLVLDCVLPREDFRDAFVSLKFDRIEDLPKGAVVGTSSLRRKAQLMSFRPDIQVVEFRGNVQTRLKKLADGVADATFLAMAGLNRLGVQDVPRTPISENEMLPAIAQGAICIERRDDDAATTQSLSLIHDEATGLLVEAERALLRGLDGSCQTPIGGLAIAQGNGELFLRGEIVRPDGSETLKGERRGPLAKGAELGADLAADLLSRAGQDFMKTEN